MKKRAEKNSRKLFTIFLFLISWLAHSQRSISLQAAIDTALANNLELKNAELVSEYRAKLVHAGSYISPAMLTGEYGQINSAYHDNKFSLSQSFNFPTVYGRQKNVQKSVMHESIFEGEIKECELIREISTIYFDILTARHKQKILVKSDSLHSVLVSDIQSRFKSENKAAQQLAFEMQRGQTHTQLQQLTMELEILELRFRILLNSKTTFLPQEGSLKNVLKTSPDAVTSAQHPLILLLQQQDKTAQNVLKLEKSRLLPDLFVGYSSMTIKGMGADDLYYNGTARFQLVQVGLGLPLFFGPRKASINSAKSGQLISENRYEAGLQHFKTELMQALARYKAASKNVDYYENEGLKKAEALSELAEKQFRNDLISYSDYMILTGQAANVEVDYYNALQNLNDAIIQINYLSAQKRQ